VFSEDIISITVPLKWIVIEQYASGVSSDPCLDGTAYGAFCVCSECMDSQLINIFDKAFNIKARFNILNKGRVNGDFEVSPVYSEVRNVCITKFETIVPNQGTVQKVYYFSNGEFPRYIPVREIPKDIETHNTNFNVNVHEYDRITEETVKCALEELIRGALV